MSNASFNSDGLDGLPPIVIGDGVDGCIALGICRTTEEETEFRCVEYFFPGLDGGGSMNFGLTVPQIIWNLELEAYSLADLLAFEAKFAHYRPSVRAMGGNPGPLPPPPEGGGDPPPLPPSGSITRRGIYTLTSENGMIWFNVAFMKYQRLELRAVPALTPWGDPTTRPLRIARVTWRWMQQIPPGAS